jgi:hypothetical protein
VGLLALLRRCLAFFGLAFFGPVSALASARRSAFSALRCRLRLEELLALVFAPEGGVFASDFLGPLALLALTVATAAVRNSLGALLVVFLLWLVWEGWLMGDEMR